QAIAVVSGANAKFGDCRQSQSLDATALGNQTVAAEPLAAADQLGFGVCTGHTTELPTQVGDGIGMVALNQRGDAAGLGACVASAGMAAEGELDAIDRSVALQAAVDAHRLLLVLCRNQQRVDMAAQI